MRLKNETKQFVIVALFLLAFGAFSTGCASAGAGGAPDDQSPSAQVQGRKAAFGVRTVRHLDVALLSARQMFEGVGGYQADQVTIVVCGKAVKSLLKDSDIEQKIARTRDLGDVHVVACGITLEAMKIDPAQLAPSVEAVPNGFIELARLQALGYDAVVL